MKFKVVAAVLLAACFLTGVSVAEEKGSTPTPKAKPAASAAEKELTQKQKMLEQYEQALEKREVTLDRAMSVLNTSIASFDSATNIWTIFLTVAGIIVGALTAIITGFGIYWWNRFRMLKSDLEEELKKGKETLAEIDPVVKKIKGYEKDVEAARKNTVGSVQEMTVGKEEKPSPEMKAKIDELAKKIDFLESFGVEPKPEDYINKGISFFWDKNYEKALIAFEHAIKLNPKIEWAWNNKGATLNELKRYGEALIAIEQAIKLNPKNDSAWNNKGASLGHFKRDEEALIAYEHAIKLNPKNDSAWNNKGASLGHFKRHEEALAAYEQAITLNPKNDAAWNNKGASLGHLKRHEEALAAYEQAITLNPKHEWAWSNRGESLAGLKRIDEAKEAYKKASIVTDYLDKKAYCEACLYYLEGKREESLAVLGKAISLDEINKERALRNVEVFGSLFDDPEFKRLTS